MSRLPRRLSCCSRGQPRLTCEFSLSLRCPGFVHCPFELTTRSNSVLRGTLIVYRAPEVAAASARGNRSYAHRVSRRLDVDAH